MTVLQLSITWALYKPLCQCQKKLSLHQDSAIMEYLSARLRHRLQILLPLYLREPINSGPAERREAARYRV